LKLSELIKELDRVFSLFIRQRDSDENGKGKCITCSKVGDYRKMDCGHYVPRMVYATRWDETNAYLQCINCNQFDSGNLIKFAEEIDKKHAEGYSEKLRCKRHFFYKVERLELIDKIDYYKSKIKQ